MQGDGEFDDAEPGSEMAAGDRDGVDHLGAHGLGHRRQLRFGQAAQGGGVRDTVEKCALLWGNRHGINLYRTGSV